ncbi:MAG: phosphoglucomutase/phosphomannomutase family protein [Elusimicrobia bacterium]|nr:phosphoglucomutase/phosphomannomutase family protein [Elusimicrobiota bacterium]
MAIQFGTSGWRAVFADDFTYLNVRKLTHAIAGHVKENLEFGYRNPDYSQRAAKLPPGHPPMVVVGYDTRFQSEDFAREAAEVFAADGVRVLFSDKDVPTPAVAWGILNNLAVGGVVITASHNPARYNGYKWSPWWGGPALPAATDDVERRVGLLGSVSVAAMNSEKAAREGWIVQKDFLAPYFKQLASLLDVKKLKGAKLKVGVDALNGAARRYLRPFLESVGVSVIALREERDVNFGGHSTEPAPELLGDLVELMKKKGLALGLACDGDADRFGIMDAGGEWIPPNDVLALALDHLVRNRGMRGKVARSLMTSHFLDAVAKSHGLDVRETPVGFKYIGELLRGGGFLMGGEESGGLSIQGHVPEKDGILACLLMAELVAYDKKPLAKIRETLQKKVGSFFNVRRNFHLSRAYEVSALEERLRVKPPLSLGGSSVWRIDQTDGFKFVMKDGSWMGLRSSGTEPVVRLYAEASREDKLEELVTAGENLIKGKTRV